MTTCVECGRELAMRPYPMTFGGLEFWTDTRILRLGNWVTGLSRRPAAILTILMESPNRLHTREALITKIGAWETSPRVLDTYIYFLRRVLRQAEANVEIITIKGDGFVLRQKPTLGDHVNDWEGK